MFLVCVVLVDVFGWVVIDFWVLVIDWCNFCCMYCMLVEGFDWLFKFELFMFEELMCVIGVVVWLGVIFVWFMGGESLLCCGLFELV